MQIHKIIEALARILENPTAQKGYEDMKKHYAEAGKEYAAIAIQHLIETRFGHDSKPHDN